MEAGLVARGVTLRLETRGRHSGLPRGVTIGYVETAARSLLVAASADSSHWAQNLRAQPRCTVELAGERRDYLAVLLEGHERAEAVAGLIIKYGTPAEGLGAGPAFRLDLCP